MELVHEAVIERCKILEAVRAGFLEPLEEKYLRAGIELLQQVTELCHRIAAGRNA